MMKPVAWMFAMAFALALAAPHLAETGNGQTPPTAMRSDAGSAASMTPMEEPKVAVAADYRGHFMVHPTIDNFRIQMMVDSGASFVALTETDATSLGIRPAPGEFNIRLGTANGSVMGARVLLREIRLESITVRDVEAIVLPARALSTSLLGTSFLSRLKSYEVRAGRLILRG